MKNKGIAIFLIVIAVVIVIIVAKDFVSTKIGNQPDNPYEYNIDQYKSVEAGLIHYKESKQIGVNVENPRGLAYKNKIIYLLSDKLLQLIELDGKIKNKIVLPDNPGCISITDENKILIGYTNFIEYRNSSGENTHTSVEEDDSTVFTSITLIDESIYVADAGGRRVVIYNNVLEKTDEFEGQSGTESVHGFIIPSPYFDLAVNSNNELWIVNPGMHSFQHYSADGKLVKSWDKISIEIEGFSGCCNPAHFAFLPNGNIVTSEKGLVRIKIYKPYGEFVSVVAPPEKFTEDGHAPEVVVDEDNNIIALDFDKKIIRFFELTENI